MKLRKYQARLLALLAFTTPLLQAEDVVNIKDIGMEMARDLASEAVLHCRKQGYQVSAVVVDRNGLVRAALRDDLAARFTLQIAEEKANAVVLSATDSGSFRQNRADIRSEMNHVHGILMLTGGLPVNAGGYRLGAIGVSGAPGGEKDAACAAHALSQLGERLEFALE